MQSEDTHALEAECGELQKKNERLRIALHYFEGCSYPVAKEINPRGHAWRGEDALDFALDEARAALAYQQQAREK